MLSQSIDFSKIVILDTETTGTDPVYDRITQIAIIHGDKTFNSLINPMMPIPKEVQDMNGITDEKVKDAPTFANIAFKFVHMLPSEGNGLFLMAYNAIGLDVPILWEELHRCNYPWHIDLNRVIDPGIIFKKKEPRDLSAAVKFFCSREMAGAHDALNDARETLNVFNGQIHRYVDVAEMGLEQLSDYSRHANICDVHGKIAINKDGDYIYNFGKKRGVRIEDDPGFGRWMLSKDFSDNTKEWIDRAFQAIEEKWQRIQEAEHTAQEEHGREMRESQGGLF